MIKRELAKDPKLANEDWSRFLPKFQKRKQKKRAPLLAEDGTVLKPSKPKRVEKKPYTPFPPPQQPSKVRPP